MSVSFTDMLLKEIGPVPAIGNKYFIADGTWSLFELIEYVFDYMPPSDILLTSFSISEASLRSLLNLKESGKIKSLRGLFDPSLRKTKTPLLYFAAEIFDQIRLAPNHSKIILIKSPNRCLTIMASANLGRNRRIETGVLEACEHVFRFYQTNLESIFSEAIEL